MSALAAMLPPLYQLPYTDENGVEWFIQPPWALAGAVPAAVGPEGVVLTGDLERYLEWLWEKASRQSEGREVYIAALGGQTLAERYRLTDAQVRDQAQRYALEGPYSNRFYAFQHYYQLVSPPLAHSDAAIRVAVDTFVIVYCHDAMHVEQPERFAEDQVTTLLFRAPTSDADPESDEFRRWRRFLAMLGDVVLPVTKKAMGACVRRLERTTPHALQRAARYMVALNWDERSAGVDGIASQLAATHV